MVEVGQVCILLDERKVLDETRASIWSRIEFHVDKILGIEILLTLFD
jgi:hypothetical protein